MKRFPVYGYRTDHHHPKLAMLLGYAVFENDEWIMTELK
jgi:hypothetical protein